MELKQIEFFLKLYEEKNFTKASKSLYITQQGLSRSISNLENEFGLPLFDRTSKAVLPTEYGHRLYHYFKKADITIKEIYKEVENIRTSCAGELRIACTIGSFYCLDMSVILEFKNTYPDVKVYYEEVPETDADLQLLTGYWDIGFLTDPIDKSLFHCHKVFEEPVYAYVHKDHPLASNSFITHEDLHNHKLLLYPLSHKGRLAFDEIFARKNLNMNVVFESPYAFNLVPLLERNEGITLSTPSVLSKIISNNIREIPLLEKNNWSLSLAWKKDASLSLPAKLFLNFIINYETNRSRIV